MPFISLTRPAAQNNTTRRTSTNRTGNSQRTGFSRAASSSDNVQLSSRAQLAGAANRVSSVLSGLGFSTGTAARSSVASSSSNSGRAAQGSSNGSSGSSMVSNVASALDAASILNPVTAPLTIGRRAVNLALVESGAVTPDRSSRLGAFQATSGNERGTTGRAAHNAIGGIYLALGTFGQDQIGNVFNSSQARELFDQPLSNGSRRRLAEVEHGYWDRQRRESGTSGGYMGSAFSPAARDTIQQFMGWI